MGPEGVQESQPFLGSCNSCTTPVLLQDKGNRGFCAPYALGSGLPPGVKSKEGQLLSDVLKKGAKEISRSGDSVRACNALMQAHGWQGAPPSHPPFVSLCVAMRAARQAALHTHCLPCAMVSRQVCVCVCVAAAKLPLHNIAVDDLITQLESDRPTLVQITKTHCICIRGKEIFDSNEELALPLTVESLHRCAGGRFEKASRIVRYSPGKRVKMDGPLGDTQSKRARAE